VSLVNSPTSEAGTSVSLNTSMTAFHISICSTQSIGGRGLILRIVVPAL
jgi:hypothetical protein